MEGKTGEEFGGGRHRLESEPCATTSASSSTATAICRSGRRRPNAAAWPITAPRPMRCRAWSTRSPSICSAASSACSRMGSLRYEVKLEVMYKTNIEIRAMKRLVRRLPAGHQPLCRAANGITAIRMCFRRRHVVHEGQAGEARAGAAGDQPPLEKRVHYASGSGGSHERPRDHPRDGRPAAAVDAMEIIVERETGRCPPTTRRFPPGHPTGTCLCTVPSRNEVRSAAFSTDAPSSDALSLGRIPTLFNNMRRPPAGGLPHYHARGAWRGRGSAPS